MFDPLSYFIGHAESENHVLNRSGSLLTQTRQTLTQTRRTLATAQQRIADKKAKIQAERQATQLMKDQMKAKTAKVAADKLAIIKQERANVKLEQQKVLQERQAAVRFEKELQTSEQRRFATLVEYITRKADGAYRCALVSVTSDPYLIFIRNMRDLGDMDQLDKSSTTLTVRNHRIFENMGFTKNSKFYVLPNMSGSRAYGTDRYPTDPSAIEVSIKTHAEINIGKGNPLYREGPVVMTLGEIGRNTAPFNDPNLRIEGSVASLYVTPSDTTPEGKYRLISTIKRDTGSNIVDTFMIYCKGIGLNTDEIMSRIHFYPKGWSIFK